MINSTNLGTARPPLPPFTRETAIQKVRMAEDAWNTRDPERVSLAYTRRQPLAQSGRVPGRTRGDRRLPDRANGRAKRDYRLIKELWTFADNRIAVRFAYEWHDDAGKWFRVLRQRELGVR